MYTAQVFRPALLPGILENMENDEDLQDIQDRIDHLEKLTRENNRILHKVRNQMRLGVIMRGLWWVFIIGSFLGIYYYLQPFLDQIGTTYDEIIQFPEKLKNLDLSSLNL